MSIIKDKTSISRITGNNYNCNKSYWLTLMFLDLLWKKDTDEVSTASKVHYGTLSHRMEKK